MYLLICYELTFCVRHVVLSCSDRGQHCFTIALMLNPIWNLKHRDIITMFLSLHISQTVHEIIQHSRLPEIPFNFCHWRNYKSLTKLRKEKLYAYRTQVKRGGRERRRKTDSRTRGNCCLTSSWWSCGCHRDCWARPPQWLKSNYNVGREKCLGNSWIDPLPFQACNNSGNPTVDRSQPCNTCWAPHATKRQDEKGHQKFPKINYS